MAYEGRALTIVVVNYVFASLATVTLALRCFVRLTREAFGWDDWMVLLGWAMFVVNVAMTNMSVYHGLGVENPNITAAEMAPAVKYFTMFQLFTLTGTLPVKTSICISLLRITTQASYRRILYAIMAGSVATVVISDIVIISRCRPMAFTWDKSIPNGVCSSLDTLLVLCYIFSAMNIITDLATAILPGFIVWNLKLSPRLKIAISILLGMGLFASIATTVRVKYFISLLGDENYLYGIGPLVWWSIIEIGLGIIAACLSALRPLFRFAFGNSSFGPSDHGPLPPTIGTPHQKGYMKARAIRLRDINDGLATMAVEGSENHNDYYNENANLSDGDGDGDKSSQKGILQQIPGHTESKSVGKESGILVTQSYKIEEGDVEREVSRGSTCHKHNASHGDRERTVNDIV